MLPDYAAFALCEFYCDGCFPLASVVLSLRDFPPVHFAGLVEKCNHFVCAFFRFGCSLFLACKARCEPDVLEGDSVSFCISPGGSLIDVAMQAGPNAFVIAFLIRVPCGHDLAMHFCQLGVEDNPCWMFGRRTKLKWEPGIDLIVASHLKFVVVAYGQEPTACWDFDAVCVARVNVLLKHFNLDDDKDFWRCGSTELLGTQRCQ